MKKRDSLLKMIRFIHKIYPSLFLLITISQMINAAIPFINIIFTARLIDTLVSEGTYAECVQYALWMIGLNAGFILAYQGLQKIVNLRKYNLGNSIWGEIASHALVMDYELLEKQETMELIEKAVRGMQSHGGPQTICEIFERSIRAIVDVVYSVLLLIPLFIPQKAEVEIPMSALLNTPLGMIPIGAALAVSLIVLYFLNQKFAKLQQDSFETNVSGNTKLGYLTGPMMEYTWGKDIRMNRLDYSFVNNLQKSNGKIFENLFHLQCRGSKLASANMLVAMFFSLICYLYVGAKAMHGLISVGNVAMYVSTFTKFGTVLGELVDLYVQLQISAEYHSYFVDYVEIENRKYEGTLPIEKRDDGEYELEFRNVTFSYPNSEKPVLDHVSFKIRVGGKIALVGPNGAGKTTFIKLLCRLYDPTEGEILLNGVDIRYYDYTEYVQLFSVVFQDFKLFSFSIAENVAASRNFNEEKVKECLEKAGFKMKEETFEHDIYTNLYQLEDEGVEISGGEAQKIAIARALYKDAPVVILDEPTAALDPESEYEIYCSFDKLVEEKTAIYISHRMSACRFCDQILVFDAGKIVQKGSHDELIDDLDGLYHEMWNAQAKYYK